jgi:signal transduction histidine kinase
MQQSYHPVLGGPRPIGSRPLALGDGSGAPVIGTHADFSRGPVGASDRAAALGRRDLNVLAGARPSVSITSPQHRNGVAADYEALQSLERVARALVSIDRGAEAVCREVVEITADHLAVPWALVALRPLVLPDTATRLVAWHRQNRIIVDGYHLPAYVRARIQRALAQPDHAAANGEVFVALHRRGLVQGVLAGLRGEPGVADLPVDEGDLRFLRILADQAGVALQIEDTLRRSAELARRAARASKSAGALLGRNRELRDDVRDGFDLARRQLLVSDERRRLAQMLHESVAQQVLSAGLAIELCRAQAPVGSAEHERLDHAKQLTHDALDTVRSAIQFLSTDSAAADENLPAMLERLQSDHARANFALSVAVAGRPVALTDPARRSLFQIANECLFNTAVHAGARRAVIRLTYTRDELRLAVADDGTGLPETIRKIIRGDVPGTGAGYHRGLLDIAWRVDELGGVLGVERSDLGGILIDVTVPLALIVDGGPVSGGPDG